VEKHPTERNSMITVKGTWTANVSQSFEIEVESEDEIEAAIEDEMHPRNVVELLDFAYEIDSQEKDEDD
jgi:hypothetical protein